ncbi:MAG: hypothetical protein WCT20_01455 [Candidatus Babeliales bacterium]|jgi:hypothetical protein
MKTLLITTLFCTLSCNATNGVDNRISNATVGGVIGGTTIVATIGILFTHYAYEQRKSGDKISAKGFWYWLIKNHKSEAFAYAAALAGGLLVGYINANAAMESYQENQFIATLSDPNYQPGSEDQSISPYGDYF